MGFCMTQIHGNKNFFSLPKILSETLFSLRTFSETPSRATAGFLSEMGKGFTGFTSYGNFYDKRVKAIFMVGDGRG